MDGIEEKEKEKEKEPDEGSPDFYFEIGLGNFI